MKVKKSEYENWQSRPHSHAIDAAANVLVQGKGCNQEKNCRGRSWGYAVDQEPDISRINVAEKDAECREQEPAFIGESGYKKSEQRLIDVLKSAPFHKELVPQVPETESRLMHLLEPGKIPHGVRG